MEKAAAAEVEAEALEAEAAEAAEAEAELPSAAAVKRMKKADLIGFAEEKGIELDASATNAEMAETLISALGL